MNEREIDVSVSEGAREDVGDNKIYQDEGKLVREGKDVIGNLIQNCIDVSPKDFIVCILQIKGDLN